jgi:hypothetical protein
VSAFTRLRFREALALLLRHNVEFIVVGGVGALLQGSPLSTLDLDIVHNRTPENIQKLQLALAEMHAHYRIKPGLSPTASHLESNGHQLLATDFGSLDVLAVIGRASDFESLLPFCRMTTVEGSGEVRVLELSKLIEVKEETAGDKDRAQLPILKQVLREIQAREKT